MSAPHGTKAKGAAPDQESAPSKIPQTDCIPLADLVQLNLQGRSLAAEFLLDLKQDKYPDQDELFMSVSVFVTFPTVAARTTFRGFCRTLQRTLERVQS